MQLPFRSAASTTARRFSGILAVSLLAAGYAVAPIPAAARDIEGLPPQCAKAGDELAKLKCGRAVFQKRIADANARSAAADKQIAANKKNSEAALTEKSCYDALLGEVNAAKKVAPLTPEQKAAFKTRAASCEKS